MSSSCVRSSVPSGKSGCHLCKNKLSDLGATPAWRSSQTRSASTACFSSVAGSAVADGLPGHPIGSRRQWMPVASRWGSRPPTCPAMRPAALGELGALTKSVRRAVEGRSHVEDAYTSQAALDAPKKAPGKNKPSRSTPGGPSTVDTVTRERWLKAGFARSTPTPTYHRVRIYEPIEKGHSVRMDYAVRRASRF